MPNFFDKLGNYYRQIGRDLREKANTAGIFPNASDRGFSRELTYQKFLREHLPSVCNIYLGGFIFNLDGDESKQIDIIVTSGNSIQYKFQSDSSGGKSFSCVEGTIGVISVKTRIESRELIEAIENIHSIPDKQPLGIPVSPFFQIRDYDDWPYKVIFGYSGMSLMKIRDKLNEYYSSNPQIPFFRRPNLVHILGQGFLVKVGEGGGTTRDGTNIPPNSYHLSLDTTDAIGLCLTIMQIQIKSFASNNIFYNFDLIIDKIL